MMRHYIFFIFIFSFCSSILAQDKHHPKLAVIIVVDQFAHHYLKKVRPFLRGGLKKLLDNGVEYINAHYPHAMPATAPGQTTLNTGVEPKDHGVVVNYWHDANNEKHPSTLDTPENAAEFRP